MRYYTREENVRYLRRFTNYNTSRYSDGQLASIRRKTEATIEKKISAILAYQESHNIVRIPYTLEKLRKKTIDELREIEAKYGIGTFPEKRNKKKKTEQIVEQIKMSDLPKEDLAIPQIQTDSIQEQNEEMAYLTEEEIKMMYPGEDYTIPELKDRGIILNVDSPKFNSHEEERRIKKLKLEIAKSIIEIQKKLNLQFYNLSDADIEKISLDELKEMYQYITSFVTGYPKFEENAQKLGLKFPKE